MHHKLGSSLLSSFAQVPQVEKQHSTASLAESLVDLRTRRVRLPVAKGLTATCTANVVQQTLTVWPNLLAAAKGLGTRSLIHQHTDNTAYKSSHDRALGVPSVPTGAASTEPSGVVSCHHESREQVMQWENCTLHAVPAKRKYTTAQCDHKPDSGVEGLPDQCSKPLASCRNLTRPSKIAFKKPIIILM